MEVNVSNQKNHSKIQQYLRNASAKTVVATMLATGALLTPIKAYAPQASATNIVVKQETQKMPEQEQQKALEQESIQISKLFQSPHNSGSKAKFIYANPKYVRNMLKEANWASKELNIPKPLILSQWVLETGMHTNAPSPTAIANNNLGGIYTRDLNIKRFTTLHDFTVRYVRTLRKDGVTNLDDLFVIAERLHKGHYMSTDTKTYENGMMVALSFLGKANADCNTYYKKCLKGNNAKRLRR